VVVAVSRVVDGDTIDVADGRRVRLIGVDTPELRPEAQCYGPEASAFLHQLLPAGTDVRLVTDVREFDRFGRTLAYVFRASDDLFVNLNLVETGHATTLTIDPNTAHAATFAAAEGDARADGRGLWSACPR
jgi:micrococcal nuclease